MPGDKDSAYSFILVEPNETFYLADSYGYIKDKIENAEDNEFISLFQNGKYTDKKIMILKKRIKGYGEI